MQLFEQRALAHTAWTHHCVQQSIESQPLSEPSVHADAKEPRLLASGHCPRLRVTYLLLVCNAERQKALHRQHRRRQLPQLRAPRAQTIPTPLLCSKTLPCSCLAECGAATGCALAREALCPTQIALHSQPRAQGSPQPRESNEGLNSSRRIWYALAASHAEQAKAACGVCQQANCSAPD